MEGERGRGSRHEGGAYYYDKGLRFENKEMFVLFYKISHVRDFVGGCYRFVSSSVLLASDK